MQPDFSEQCHNLVTFAAQQWLKVMKTDQVYTEASMSITTCSSKAMCQICPTSMPQGVHKRQETFLTSLLLGGNWLRALTINEGKIANYEDQHPSSVAGSKHEDRRAQCHGMAYQGARSFALLWHSRPYCQAVFPEFLHS